ARRLGPDATGTIALLSSILEVLLAIFGFGLATGITYFTSRGEWSVRHALRESQALALPLGCIGVGLGCAFFALTRDELFAGNSVVSLLLGIGYLPFQLGRGFIAAIALARERYEAYAAIELVRTAVLIAVAVVLTFLIGVDGALIGIAASGVISYVAAAVWAVRFARVAPENAAAGG